MILAIKMEDNELQRDNKKNHILKIIGIQLLGWSVDRHDEEARTIEV